MSISKNITDELNLLSEEDRRRLLAPPVGPVRMILDTDTANEIDDQFALTWALLSPESLKLEGVTAEPFSFQHLRPGMLQTRDIIARGGPRTAEEIALVDSFGSWIEGYGLLGQDPDQVEFVPPDIGAELSYLEILKVYDKLGVAADGMTFRGSPGYLTDLAKPIRSAAVEHIIERALAPSGEPLYIAAIGCLTNLASAMLLAPEIIKNIVVLWTSSYPSHAPHSNKPSLNLVQDKLASQLLFASGAAHVYLPGYHVGAQLRLSLPEIETFVRPHGAIGSYLHELFTHNPIHAQRGTTDRERRSWVIWDIINIAWLINPTWVPTMLTASPLLGDDFHWSMPDHPHLMREAYDVDRDAIFIDFYDKLKAAAAA